MFVFVYFCTILCVSQTVRSECTVVSHHTDLCVLSVETALRPSLVSMYHGAITYISIVVIISGKMMKIL